MLLFTPENQLPAGAGFRLFDWQHLGMLLLVVGLVALVIMRRKNYKQAKADEPRVIHMDNGETFKSYYSK